MKIAICTIVKNENHYIRNWVSYHLRLGFDTIYLYDNNSDNINISSTGKVEHLEDEINDYIEEGKVIVIDFRNLYAVQMISYNHFLSKYAMNFDWTAFIDGDEFITINPKFFDFKEFISQDIFNNCDEIHLSWCVYKGYQIYANYNRTIEERFPFPDISSPENKHIKTILNKRIVDKVKFVNPHYTNGEIVCLDDSGNRCFGNYPFKCHTFKNAYIRHYCCKSLEEYINKIKRGNADSNMKAKLDFWFEQNGPMTKEAEDFLKTIKQPEN